MFHNLQNLDSCFIFHKIEKYSFKVNVLPKTIEKYMIFTIQQPKQKDIKQDLH